MRNITGIIGAALLVVAVGAFVFFSGRGSFSNTSSSTAADTTLESFTELARGAQSSVAARANYLITSSAQLGELWKMIDAAGQTPTVDFAKNDVIAVFAGTEPTAGYAIAVTKIADGAARNVTVTLTKPGGSCILAQSLTAPYQVVMLAKTMLPLAHEDAIDVVSCLQ